MVTAEEALARKFHKTYERLAPQYGYETRKDSAVPSKNKNLMVAVCAEVIKSYFDKQERVDNDKAAV